MTLGEPTFRELFFGVALKGKPFQGLLGNFFNRVHLQYLSEWINYLQRANYMRGPYLKRNEAENKVVLTKRSLNFILVFQCVFI